IPTMSEPANVPTSAPHAADLSAASWAFRTAAPLWLRRAGLEEEAAALAALPAFAQPADVERALGALQRATERAEEAWDEAWSSVRSKRWSAEWRADREAARAVAYERAAAGHEAIPDARWTAAWDAALA